MSFTDEELIEFYKKLDLLKKEFKTNRMFAFDLMPQQFFLRVRHLKTQIYGLRIQGYFAYHLDYDITPSSWDCGDFKNGMGHDIEFKVSFKDDESQSINCKQIRLWQDLDFYYVLSVDYRDYNNIKYKMYELTKQEMEQECKLMKATAVANTKENTTEKSSLGFSIKENTEHYKRWEENYLNKKFDIDKIVQKSLNKEETIKQKLIINSLTEYQNCNTI